MTTSMIFKCGIAITQCSSPQLLKSNFNPGVISLLGTFSKKHDYHSTYFSKHLQLSTNEKLPKKQDYQVLDPNEPTRPLTILYSWTLAKDHNVMKYAKLHLDKGIDVLKIKTLPMDLLYPTTGGQLIADETLKFLEANPSFNPIIMHGLSVGSYSFGELVLKIVADDKYLDIKNRFIGQVWDSPVDVHGLPPGLSRAITSNKAFQVSLENIFKLHLKLNYNIATKYYDRCSHAIHENLIGVPGLFLYSKGDYVSTPEMNKDVYKTWESKNLAVYAKCFETSKHCCHLREEREEYIFQLYSFLERVGAIEPSKSRIAVSAN